MKRSSAAAWNFLLSLEDEKKAGIRRPSSSGSMNHQQVSSPQLKSQQQVQIDSQIASDNNLSANSSSDGNNGSSASSGNIGAAFDPSRLKPEGVNATEIVHLNDGAKLGLFLFYLFHSNSNYFVIHDDFIEL